MARHRHLHEDSDAWKDGALDDYTNERATNRLRELNREPQTLRPLTMPHTGGGVASPKFSAITNAPIRTPRK